MTSRQQYEKASLASGEISPALSAATDLRAYQTGLAAQENMVTVLEGVATRRPGTRFVLEAKDHTQRGKLWPFRYTSGDYYMLAFNGGKMRVIRDAGYVVSGGSPLEVDIPWSEGQLASLRAAPLQNTLTFTCAGGRVRKVTRIAADNWTVAEYLPLNGPVETQNLDKSVTIAPSAISGAINLLGINSPFNTGMVGGVMRIDEANAILTQLWTAGETISVPLTAEPSPTSAFGNLSSLGNLTDGNPATLSSLTGTECYAGFNWAAAVPIAAFTLSGAASTGPPPSGGFTSSSAQLVLELWAKVGAVPANATDGTLLASLSLIDNPSNAAGLFIYAPDATLLWNNAWFRLRSLSGSVTFNVATAAPMAIAGALQLQLRRWNDNIYQPLSGGTSGVAPPVHQEGDASYGGVAWRFRSKTYGFVRLTAVADVNHASGTVILQLPDSALLVSTYRWWPPSWSDGSGWPEIIQQHQQKFLFTRKNRLWMTRPATRDDFLFTADSDSAIAVTLTSPDGSLVEIQWMTAAGIVVLGAADLEWMLRAPASNDVLQAQTIDPVPDSQEGSVAQIVAKVDRGVIFTGRSGKRLHYLKFDALTQQLAPEEVSAAARHIPMPGVVATAWQKDPHKILWMVLSDGTLAAMTFMPAQKIVALHRHPMANGFVEDIAALPATNDGRTEIYLWVRRTIGGSTKRYIELLQPFFEPANAAHPTADGAWFLDCALHYAGAPVSSITGLSHLEGQAVGVFADGAEQKAKIVVGGAIALDRPASDVVVGLPITWRIKDLPRSLALPVGSSRGKAQRATHMVADVLNAAGGLVRITHPKTDPNDDDDDTQFVTLTESGGSDYGAAPKLYTGTIAMTVQSDSASEAVVEMVGEDAMPFTLRAIVPDILTEGD